MKTQESPRTRFTGLRITDTIRLHDTNSNSITENNSSSPKMTTMCNQFEDYSRINDLYGSNSDQKHIVDSKTEVIEKNYDVFKEMYSDGQNKDPVALDELAEDLMEPRPQEEAVEDFSGSRPSSSAQVKSKTMKKQEDSDDDDPDLTELYNSMIKRNPKPASPSLPASKIPRVTRPKLPSVKNYDFDYNPGGRYPPHGIGTELSDFVPATPMYTTRSRCRTNSDGEKDIEKRKLYIVESGDEESSPKKKNKRQLDLVLPGMSYRLKA